MDSHCINLYNNCIMELSKYHNHNQVIQRINFDYNIYNLYRNINKNTETITILSPSHYILHRLRLYGDSIERSNHPAQFNYRYINKMKNILEKN
jgi:hypothetical protein